MIALAPALLSTLALVPGKNLLVNADFEEGASKSVRQWESIWPSTLLTKSPEFEWSSEGAHGGKHCARLRTSEAKGYSSFTQQLAAPPKDARSVHLEGWIRFEPEATQSGTPSLMLLFYDPAKEGSEVMRPVALPKGAQGWTKVSLDASVPPGAKAWMLRCGMLGVGTSSFDDLSLSASSTDVEALTLLHAHGDYRVEVTRKSADPWIEFSFPFPFEGQTPLTLNVSTQPARRVQRLELVSDRENRYLRVHLKPDDSEGPTDVRLDALVMVRDLPRGDGKDVPLLPREKLPKDVALYFQKTPGIDPDDPGILAVAKTVKTATLAEAALGVLGWMRANFKYVGGGDQGGKASFERKNAVCTGHANLAASLFQAAGVPCRILGCLTGERLQEHYIVELWSPKELWRRAESTSEVFPIRDDSHLVLHIAYPDFDRSSGNVPLRLRFQDGCKGNYRMGTDTCWQGMSAAGSVALTPEEALRVEALARAAFAAWEKKPLEEDTARLLVAPKGKEKPLSEPATELVARTDRFARP